MIDLIKKYTVLLIIGIVLSRILTGLTLLLFPDILTTKLPDGAMSTLGNGILTYGFQNLINIVFIILIARNMKIENTKSPIILIATFFSSFIGVVFFLLTMAYNRLNQIKG